MPPAAVLPGGHAGQGGGSLPRAPGGEGSGKLRVALLVPRVHFHAPFALRALAPRAREGLDRYLVVTTPKLSPGPAPLWRKLGRLFRDSGPDFLLAMALLRALHLARGSLERLAGRPPEDRRSLSVGEACRLLRAEVEPARSVRQPELAARLRAFAPDLLCAVFFNQVVPAELLRLPRLGAVNLHPSYLPRYRGVSPCFWALARGEAWTGVTIHGMTAEIDRGPILARARLEIGPADTVHSLYRRSALLGGRLLAGLLAEPGRLLLPGEAPGEAGSAFGAITRAAVGELRARGRRFF